MQLDESTLASATVEDLQKEAPTGWSLFGTFTAAFVLISLPFLYVPLANGDVAGAVLLWTYYVRGLPTALSRDLLGRYVCMVFAPPLFAYCAWIAQNRKLEPSRSIARGSGALLSFFWHLWSVIVYSEW